MLVGTAHSGDTFPPAQLRVPHGQRLVVGDEPRRSPDLDAIGLEQIAKLPRRAAFLGMVDREERAACLYRFPYLCHLIVAPAPEVDEAIVDEAVRPVNGPHVGVAVVGADLDARDEEQVRGCMTLQQWQVAERVVLGDGDEVEPLGLGHRHQIRQRCRPVGMPGVSVQIAPVPPRPALRSPVLMLLCLFASPLSCLPAALLPCSLSLLLQRHDDPVIASLGSKLVETQYDVPGAGLHRAGEVAGGGLVGGDGELPSCRAAPAPKPLRVQELGPPCVE